MSSMNKIVKESKTIKTLFAENPEFVNSMTIDKLNDYYNACGNPRLRNIIKTLDLMYCGVYPDINNMNADEIYSMISSLMYIENDILYQILTLIRFHPKFDMIGFTLSSNEIIKELLTSFYENHLRFTTLKENLICFDFVQLLKYKSYTLTDDDISLAIKCESLQVVKYILNNGYDTDRLSKDDKTWVQENVTQNIQNKIISDSSVLSLVRQYNSNVFEDITLKKLNIHLNKVLEISNHVPNIIERLTQIYKGVYPTTTDEYVQIIKDLYFLDSCKINDVITSLNSCKYKNDVNALLPDTIKYDHKVLS